MCRTLSFLLLLAMSMSLIDSTTGQSRVITFVNNCAAGMNMWITTDSAGYYGNVYPSAPNGGVVPGYSTQFYIDDTAGLPNGRFWPKFQCDNPDGYGLDCWMGSELETETCTSYFCPEHTSLYIQVAAITGGTTTAMHYQIITLSANTMTVTIQPTGITCENNAAVNELGDPPAIIDGTCNDSTPQSLTITISDCGDWRP